MFFACTFSEIKDFFLCPFLSVEVTGHISIKTQRIWFKSKQGKLKVAFPWTFPIKKKEKTTYLSEICFMWAWFISWMLHYVKNCQWKGCNYYICYFYSMYITHCIHMCVCVCVLIENWFNCFSLMVCCFGLINYSNFVIQSL